MALVPSFYERVQEKYDVSVYVVPYLTLLPDGSSDEKQETS